MTYLKRTGSVMLIMMFLISTVFAQGVSPQQQQGQKLYQEYAQLNQQLQMLQQQALSDPEIKQMSQNFADKVEAAMIAQDASLKQALDKRDNLVDQFKEAQQASDNDKITSIQKEYQQVLQTIKPVQQQVMQQNEGLRNQAQKIEDKVMSKMEELNPDAPQMLSRIKEISMQLQQMQGGGQ